MRHKNNSEECSSEFGEKELGRERAMVAPQELKNVQSPIEGHEGCRGARSRALKRL